MRSTSIRALVALALLSVAPHLLACDYKQVTVRVLDFDTNAVIGVRFWRLSESSGEFLAGGRVLFSEVYQEDGEEWVDYTVVNEDGSEGLTLPARIVRDGANPDAVTVDLYYSRFEGPGWYRVSAFNGAGDSDLSDEQVYL